MARVHILAMRYLCPIAINNIAMFFLDGQLDKLMVSLAASWQYPNSSYSYDILFCLNGCCWKIKVSTTVLLLFWCLTLPYLFCSARASYGPNKTLIVKVARNRLWSFGLIPNISTIYSKPGYPRHMPDTVKPEYSAVMHAKYEVTPANSFGTAFL